MPESVLTQTIPLLLAGGVCLAELAGGVAGAFAVLLVGAGAAAGGGVRAVVFAAGAGAGALAVLLVGGGAEAGADAAVVSSAAVDFFERDFLVVVVSALALVLAEAPASVDAASLDLAFFELLFFVVVVSAVVALSAAVVLPAAVVESAAPADFLLLFLLVVAVVLVSAEPLATALSAESAVLLFFVLFWVVVFESAAVAVESSAAAVFFLDFEVLLVFESVVVGVESSAAAVFFFDFGGRLGIGAAVGTGRAVIGSRLSFLLLFRSGRAAIGLVARRRRLRRGAQRNVSAEQQHSRDQRQKYSLAQFHLTLPIRFGLRCGPDTQIRIVRGLGTMAPGMPCGLSLMNRRIIAEKHWEVKVNWPE